jgi:hypothetical protein
MWRCYKNITRSVIINEGFPKDTLINIMKPYLHLYYTSLYATNGTYKQCNSEYMLKKKLRLFVNYNPNFGRRYIRYKRDIFGKNKKFINFDSDHIHFYKGMNSNTNIIQRNTRSRVSDNNYEINRFLFHSISYDSVFDEYEDEEQHPLVNETNVVSYLINQIVNEPMINENSNIDIENNENDDEELEQIQDHRDQQESDTLGLDLEYSSTDDEEDDSIS